MKYLKLAEKLMHNHLLLHLLLIFQMTAVFLVLANIVSTICLTVYTRNIIKPLLNEYYCYFQSANQRQAFRAEEFSYDMKQTDINSINAQLAGETLFCSQYEILFYSKQAGNSFDILGQEQKTLENTHADIKRGKWLTDAEKESGYIRIVTNDNRYKVGEVIEGYIQVGGSDIPIKLKVTGIAKNPFSFLSVNSGATYPSSETLVRDFEINSFASITQGLVCIEDISAYVGDFEPETPRYGNYHVFFDSSLTQIQYQENLEALKRYGNVASAADIQRNTNGVINENLKSELPSLVFASIIAMAGFSVISLINVSGNMKTFSLYCLNSCRKKTLYLIILLYTLSIVLASFIPTLLVLMCAKYISELESYFAFVNSYTFLLIGVAAVVFTVIPLFFSLSVLKNLPVREIVLEYRR